MEGDDKWNKRTEVESVGRRQKRKKRMGEKQRIKKDGRDRRSETMEIKRK